MSWEAGEHVAAITISSAAFNVGNFYSNGVINMASFMQDYKTDLFPWF